MEYFAVGEFVVVAGSNKEANLLSKDGIQLGLICPTDSWIWATATKPNTQFVVIGCEDGSLLCYQILFGTVHGLHKERYAYRENMTDVVVQDMNRDMHVRINCKDLVRKVAVYHHRLAIQLSNEVNIYRQVSGARDNEPLTYRIIERIEENFDCSLLVVTAQHLILCQEKRLQGYDFRGLKVREWILDALIRYIKVVGGVAGREGILVGLKNGQVLKIFVDNPFPVEMMQIKSAVRCLDISLDRKHLAVVDEQSTCVVFNIVANEIVYQEPNANSVAWNSDYADLLCFSGNNVLSIKAGNFLACQQRMQGFVVGFSGKRVFCLHMFAMTSLEVPLSNQLYQYLERNMCSEAYQLACLGATESDWLILAMAALHDMNLDIAKKAFHRIRNSRFLELIYDIEQRQKRGETDKNAFFGDILAYEKKFTEAAEFYTKAGQEQKALDMFTDLRMFEMAQNLLAGTSGDTHKALIRKRATWAENSNDPRTAVQMYISAGDYDKAVSIMISNEYTDMLISVARKMDKTETTTLREIGRYFVEQKEYTLAAEVYTAINDTKALVIMYVHAHLWDEAFVVANANPQYKDEVYLPYARWLAENDRFDEAQKAYHKAGREEEALRVLQQLTQNAVDESRFQDAAYYYWMLSVQYLERAGQKPDEESTYVGKFYESQQLADTYYAYHAIHRFLAEPFTSYEPMALLNIARFIMNHLPPEDQNPPDRISVVNTLYTLAKHGMSLGMYKLTRQCYDKLQMLRVPTRFQDMVDIGTLMVRSKPFHDNEDLLATCYRCGKSNISTISKGAACIHCFTSFVYSFVSFDILPLVQFVCEDGISSDEAIDLINAEPPLDEAKQRHLEKIMMQPPNNTEHTPIVMDRAALTCMNKTEVIVCHWPPPLSIVYYRNIIPTISISKCPTCLRMFNTDDYELAVLQEGHCPFCHSRENLQLRRDGLEDEDGDDDDVMQNL